jgi:ectoine hydroxylase-related dioxygenase (phytanoyl-CoA dioxygenase family)
MARVVHELGSAPATGHVAAFWADGYAIVRGVFGVADIAALSQAFDRWKAEGLRHPSSFRHGNVLYLIENDPLAGRVLRFMQWPAYADAVLARYRVDPRLFALVAPLIGGDLKQISNQLIWKTPGATQATYAFHQDSRFRRPASAYREIATSYVQTAIAVDAHRPESGCMRFYPGSHRLGELMLGLSRSVVSGGFDEQQLAEVGLRPKGLVDVVLEPGDVVLWHAMMVHGSGPNRSTGDRRSHVNGYFKAANCDRGEWAFRDGKPCALGAPVLVQYDDLFTRPEPHYIDGPPHPFVAYD